jgi:hypothetical protein
MAMQKMSDGTVVYNGQQYTNEYDPKLLLALSIENSRKSTRPMPVNAQEALFQNNGLLVAPSTPQRNQQPNNAANLLNLSQPNSRLLPVSINTSGVGSAIPPQKTFKQKAQGLLNNLSDRYDNASSIFSVANEFNKAGALRPIGSPQQGNPFGMMQQQKQQQALNKLYKESGIPLNLPPEIALKLLNETNTKKPTFSTFKNTSDQNINIGNGRIIQAGESFQSDIEQFNKNPLLKSLFTQGAIMQIDNKDVKEKKLELKTFRNNSQESIIVDGKSIASGGTFQFDINNPDQEIRDLIASNQITLLEPTKQTDTLTEHKAFLKSTGLTDQDINIGQYELLTKNGLSYEQILKRVKLKKQSENPNNNINQEVGDRRYLNLNTDVIRNEDLVNGYFDVERDGKIIRVMQEGGKAHQNLKKQEAAMVTELISMKPALSNSVEIVKILNNNPKATGVIGNIFKIIPESDANKIQSFLKPIQAFTGFKTLSDMKAASPTGGALGQVSERELQFLQASWAALDITLGADEFKGQLDIVVDRMNETIKSIERGLEEFPDPLIQEYLDEMKIFVQDYSNVGFTQKDVNEMSEEEIDRELNT